MHGVCAGQALVGPDGRVLVVPKRLDDEPAGGVGVDFVQGVSEGQVVTISNDQVPGLCSRPVRQPDWVVICSAMHWL